MYIYIYINRVREGQTERLSYIRARGSEKERRRLNILYAQTQGGGGAEVGGDGGRDIKLTGFDK